MRSIWLVAAMFSTVFMALAATPASASEWGCKVLLCSADEQGWQSNPSCHPPMLKLIACRSKTFGACSWPSCPSAGTGSPGFEPFKACPAGFTPTSRGDNDRGTSSFDQSWCAKKINKCGNGSLVFNRDSDNCDEMVYVPRPRNPKPYFWNLASESGGFSKKYHFNLSKP